jgi:hypothetical protein
MRWLPAVIGVTLKLAAIVALAVYAVRSTHR